MMFRVSPWLLLLPFLLLQASGCATNPYTKRWQLLMIPQSYEANLGAQAYQDVLSDPESQSIAKSLRSCAGRENRGAHHRGSQTVEIRRGGEGL